MVTRNKLLEKVVQNPKSVRYATFVKLMRAYGYAVMNKPGAERRFVFDPTRIGKTWDDFPGSVKNEIEIFIVHQPHRSGQAVSRLTVRKALERIDVIRMVIGGETE